MTRAAKALLRADAGLREAIALRDPLALSYAKADHNAALARVDRQEGR